MKKLDMLLAIIVATLWGLNFVGAKYAIDYFPLHYWLSLRYLICAIILLPFCGQPPASLFSIFMLGTTGNFLNGAFRFTGIAVGLSVSMAVILDKLSTVFSVLLSVVIFKEKVSWKTKLGITIALLGTLFLSHSPDGMTKSPLGFILVTAGSFFWATYNIQIKRINTRRYVSLLGWSCAMGSIIPTLVSLIFEKDHINILLNAPDIAILALLFTSIGSILIPYMMWYYLLGKYNVSEVVPFSLFEPVLATVFASTLLGERITSKLIIGFIIVFTGVTIIVIRRPQHS